MSNVGCVMFVARSLAGESFGIRKARVVEVGSYDTSGGYRPLVDLHNGFYEYVGVDIREGPGVDQVCSAERLVERFGVDSFDVVIATELLEHVRDWRIVVSNLKRVCRPGGIIILTTRSKGYGYHAEPYDFWRYTAADLETIFSDCELQTIEDDPVEAGLFAKINKPGTFIEGDLSDLSLYSIVAGCRVVMLDARAFRRPGFLLLVLMAKLRQLGVWLLSDSRTGVGEAFRKQMGETRRLLELVRLR